MRKTIVQLLGGVIGIALIVMLIQMALAVRPSIGEPAAGEPATPMETPYPVVEALQARYAELGVPVKEIKLIERSPLSDEIFLQWMSEADNLDVEDRWMSFLTQREAEMAYLTVGEPISTYHIMMLTPKGELIDGLTGNLSPEMFSQQLFPAGPAAMGDEETRDLLLNEWNTGKNEWLTLQVVSDHYARENTKYVYIEWSTGTDSFEESKARVQALGGFGPAGVNNIDEFNARHGAQIALVRVKAFDTQGNLLAQYLYDAERRHESVWMAEGIEPEWMPRPAEPREAAETPVPTPTSLTIEPSLTPAPYP